MDNEQKKIDLLIRLHNLKIELRGGFTEPRVNLGELENCLDDVLVFEKNVHTSEVLYIRGDIDYSRFTKYVDYFYAYFGSLEKNTRFTIANRW